jgi:polysaccharide export outer membrane protein
MKRTRSSAAALFALCVLSLSAVAAAPPQDPVPDSVGESPTFKTRKASPGDDGEATIVISGSRPDSRSDGGAGEYLLGPHDVLKIQSLYMEELQDRTVPIDLNGVIRLPMIGRVPAAGMTPTQLEQDLTERYKEYVRDPALSVTVAEYRSQPVSVLGAVRNPGVLQVQGRRTLFEVISMAGGLADDAGYQVTITRRRDLHGPLPLPSASDDPSGRYSVAQVSVRSIMNASDPSANISILPEDVVSVPTAKMVYVLGTVQKTGGFALNEEESVSVLQAVALAQGFDRFAKPDKSVILRKQPGSTERTEIAVDVKAILEGKAEDQALREDDILYVPDSTKKRVLSRTLEATIGVGSGIAIWRVGRP